MPKVNFPGLGSCPKTFQVALDALDVIGNWEWDPASDTVRVDGFVALLFCIDPERAKAGVPLLAFLDGVHAADRERILGLIRQSAQAGSPYLAEYRVCSADGQMRWVLARGRFSCDHAGRSTGGRGIVVDVTRMRLGEATPDAVDAPGDAASLAGPLERAAEHAIAAQKALADLQEPALKLLADTLLMGLGRRLAQQQVLDRRKRMN
jgi:hypothetical protein